MVNPITIQRPPRRLCFSVRASMVVLAAICCYFALWQSTKLIGIPDVAEATRRTGRSPGPFIVTVDVSNNIHVTREYHLWLCGPILQLPFQREYPVPNPVVLGGVQPLIIIQMEEEHELGIADF